MEEEEGGGEGKREWSDHHTTWLSLKTDQYRNILTTMMAKLEVGEETRPAWKEATGLIKVSIHIPNIKPTSEEEMKKKKIGQKERKIEKPFYREARK